MFDLLGKFSKTIASTFDQYKSRFNNSKAGATVLKWFGIAVGAFIADSAVLGAVADGLVRSVKDAASAIKGMPPSDLAGPGWYLTHPFMTSWIFLRHMFGAPINVTPVYNTWIGLNVFCALVVFAVLVAKNLQSGKSESAQDRDIRELRFKRVKFDAGREIDRTPAGQVFLGLDDRRRPVRVDWSVMIEHIHILGGSGTGKTSLAVIPICLQAVRQGLPVVAIDFKGDKQAIQILAMEAKKAGKKFYLFSLHPQIKSNTYNPIGSGSTISKVERVMTALDLVYDGPAKFYTYSQQAIFLPLLRHFDRQNVKCTLWDVQALIKDPELVKEILGEDINPGHLKGLAAALTPYTDVSQINDHETDIDLARVMEDGDVVYFDLRSAVAPELAAGLGKMIALDLQSRAAFRTQADHMALIAIDEFQNMACQAFRNIISKVRSANYALLLANQALGDLRAVGEDFLNTVFSNTRTKIVFGIEHPDDVELFAKKSGQVIIPVESRSHSSSKGTGQIFTGNTTDGKSVQESEKHMIHFNVLLQLPFKKSVIFRRGQLVTLSNHAHMISAAEKDIFEATPYPNPEPKVKQGVRKASDEIERMKMIIIERKKQEKQNQNQGQGQPRQRPGQEENIGTESEDFDM